MHIEKIQIFVVSAKIPTNERFSGEFTVLSVCIARSQNKRFTLRLFSPCGTQRPRYRRKTCNVVLTKWNNFSLAISLKVESTVRLAHLGTRL